MLPRAKLSVLPNSLRLVTASLPDSELTTAVIAVKTGARSERPDERGISHLVEHQIFKSSQQYATSAELNAALAAIGAYYNASTNMEYTYYTVSAPIKHAEAAIAILSDIVLHPRFLEKEFEREKRVVFEELFRSHQQDDSYVEILFEDLMYQHQPLGWDIGGSLRTVRSLTRQKVQNYVRTWYAGRRMAVAIVGGGDMRKLQKQAVKIFSHVPEGKSRAWKPFHRGKTRLRARHRASGDKLTTMMIGVPGVNMGSPLMVPQELLRQVFGGATSSRLYNRVREKEGLVYDIFASCDYYSDAGHMAVCTSASAGHVRKVFSDILDEMRKIVEVKITPTELKSAKAVLFSELASIRDDHEELAAHYLKHVLIGGRLVQLQETWKTINTTSLETVQWLAWMMFWKKPWYVASIGPVKPLLRP